MGLNQADFGKLIGVSKVSICGYENGTRTPKLKTLRKLSDALNVDVNYLIGNDVDIVMENEDSYNKVSVSNEEIEILVELRKYVKLYNELIKNPTRVVEMIKKLSSFEK